MPELESLSSHEALAEHLRRHRLDRLIMLCDGVFAIAITLAALEIKLPEGLNSLAEVLHAARRPLLAYLISFAVIATFWINNRELFARIERPATPVIVLTLALLCGVALIPAAAHALYVGGEAVGSLRFYALVMVICGALNALAWLIAALMPGVMKKGETRGHRIGRALVIGLLPAAFLAILIDPTENALIYLLPILAAALLFRRVILPKLASPPSR